MTIIRLVSVAAAFLVFIGLPAESIELLKPPPGARNEKGATVASSKGMPMRWKSEWTMQQDMMENRPVVRFSEKGSGRYSPFDREVRWSAESVWTAGNAFLPLRTERTVTDMAGRLLVRERKSFHFEKGAVESEREERGRQSPSRQSIKIPADTLSVDGIAGALRSLPFAPSMKFPLHVLSNEPELYSVSFEMRGTERVRTPAGEFNCYKVELRPDLGFLGLFAFLIPKAYFWFTVDPPHFWVRYQGPENGRGTPEIVMELAGFERSN